MPHSSGGGSHSSGSFHSSSSSSYSSHIHIPRKHVVRSHAHFPGSRRYIYYRHDGPHFVYIDSDINEANEQLNTKTKIILYVVSMFFITIGVLIFLTSFITPNKLETIDEYKIIDNINIINDSGSLSNSLKEFENLTGIPIIIKTVDNEVWIYNYDSIESYAYEQYLLEFKEESGWLIVYSTQKEVSEFNDWHWWSIQGDNTDEILTENITDKFGNRFQDGLLKKEPLDEALISSLSLISEDCMNKRIIGDNIIGIILMIVIGLFIFIITLISSIQQKKQQDKRGYKDSELQEVETDELMEKCPFCGKEFFRGNFKKCPYCKGSLYL